MNMLKKILLIMFSVSGVYLVAQQKLTNDVVIQLIGSGLSEDSILKAIQNEDGQYVLTDAETARLKKAGVSSRVIQAMTAKMSAGSNRTTEENQVPEPERESVYYFFDEATNRLTPLTLEFGTSKGKAKLGGLAGAKTVVDLPGEQSATRLKAAEHFSFLVRVQGGPKVLAYLPDTFDLSTFAGPLHTFAASKGKRERTAYDIAFYGPVAKNKDKTGGDVGLVATRVGGNILKITSTKALPAGEYGFMVLSPPVEAAMAMAKAKADSVYYTFAVVP